MYSPYCIDYQSKTTTEVWTMNLSVTSNWVLFAELIEPISKNQVVTCY